MKVSAHPATDDFGVPEVNRSRQGQRGGDAERGRGADNCSCVARVLDAIQGQEQKSVATGQPGERLVRDHAHSQNALWRFSLGRRFEITLVDVFGRHSAPRDLASNRVGSGIAIELRADEHAANLEGRAQQFLDGPGSFGHEQLVSLTRLPTTEVASEG